MKLHIGHSSENERYAYSGIEYCSFVDDAVNFIILITLVINVIEQNLSLDVNSHSVNSKHFTKPEH